MYDGYLSTENVIEALNYAAQTVTSVGYGNWESPAIKPLVPMDRTERRILRMRGWSVLFTILGSAAYTAAVGVVVSIFIPPSPTPRLR
jgi:hypothetical protein